MGGGGRNARDVSRDIEVVVEGMLSEPNCEQESCQDSTILADSVERYTTGAGVLFIRIRGKNNPVAPVFVFGTRDLVGPWLVSSAGMRDCQTP